MMASHESFWQPHVCTLVRKHHALGFPRGEGHACRVKPLKASSEVDATSKQWYRKATALVYWKNITAPFFWIVQLQPKQMLNWWYLIMHSILAKTFPLRMKWLPSIPKSTLQRSRTGSRSAWSVHQRFPKVESPWSPAFNCLGGLNWRHCQWRFDVSLLYSPGQGSCVKQRRGWDDVHALSNTWPSHSEVRPLHKQNTVSMHSSIWQGEHLDKASTLGKTIENFSCNGSIVGNGTHPLHF